MKSILGISRLIAIACTALFLSGCLALPLMKEEQNPSAPFNGFEKLVAKDIVSVLRQIGRLSPATTTLGVNDPSLEEGSLAEAFVEEFQVAGYALRSIAGGSNSVPVSIQLDENNPDQTSAEGQSAQTITVIAGDVAVRRSYAADPQGKLMPASSMQVRGVDASHLQLEDEIFTVPASKGNPVNETPQTPLSPAPAPAPGNDQIADNSTSSQQQRAEGELLQPIEIQQNAGVNTEGLALAGPKERLHKSVISPLVATGDTAPMAHSNLSPTSMPKTSSVQAKGDEMRIVTEKILTFSEDSATVGTGNVARLRKLAQSFDPEYDIVYVEGCAFGPTGYSGGAEGLAMERAQGVHVELVDVGVPEAQIMITDGCWVEEPIEQSMPAHGVIVTVKRPYS